MRPYFSVIIPTHNRADYIGQAIGSVLAQSFTNWELIVVDDGSTDNTKKVVAEFVDSDDRIRYHYQENRELNGARNTGVRLMRGTYGCFLDDDDIYLQGHLEGLKEGRNEGRKIVRSGLIVRYPKGKELVVPAADGNEEHVLLAHWQMPSNLLPYAFAADLLRAYPFNEADVLLDDFVWLNTLLLVEGVGTVTGNTVVYHVHEQSRTATYLNEQQIKKNLEKLRKAYAVSGVREIVPVSIYRLRRAHQINHGLRRVALNGKPLRAIALWISFLGEARFPQWREWLYSVYLILRVAAGRS